MKKINKQKGYTIIETMIAVSVFLVIIVSGMGALLNGYLLHQKSRDMRSIMDSLSFVMEDISRNLRTGFDYHCVDGTLDGLLTGTNTHSCSSGSGVSFNATENARWLYYVGTNSNGLYGIYKSVDGGTAVQLTPDEVNLELPATTFVITGAEPPPDVAQPFVSIKLVGKITYKEVITPFSLQTSISQRKIDI